MSLSRAGIFIRGFYMHSKEKLVRENSQYFVYSPSAVAARVYLYPMITGYFYYEPGYFIRRSHYDNYLIMYIAKGELSLVYDGKDMNAHEGQVVLMDCRLPHGYGNLSDAMLEIAWLHFDGKTAGDFYALITENAGQVFSPSNPYPFTHHLRRIYEIFRDSSPIQEAEMSHRITVMLSALIGTHLAPASEPSSSTEIVETSLAYINEHFREPLTLEAIASNVSLSPYYFTRIFSAETGFTPHQYVIAARISFAKYQLQSGNLSVKEIAFLSGFNSESGFCSTFRKREGITPGEYRCRIQGWKG